MYMDLDEPEDGQEVPATAPAHTHMQMAMGSVWEAQMGGSKRGSSVLTRIAGASRTRKAPVLDALRPHTANELTVGLVQQALQVQPAAAAAAASSATGTTANDDDDCTAATSNGNGNASGPLLNMMTLNDFASRHHIKAVAAIAASVRDAEATAAATAVTPSPHSAAATAAKLVAKEQPAVAAAEQAQTVPSTLPPPGQALNTSSIQMPASLSVYTQRDAQLFQVAMQAVCHVKKTKQVAVEQPPLLEAKWMGFLLRRATPPFRDCINQANCFMARMDGGRDRGRFPCVQFHTPVQYEFVVRTGQLPPRMAGLCVLCLATIYVEASAHLTAQGSGGDVRLNIPFYNLVDRPGEYVKEACLTQTLGQLNGVQLTIRAPTMTDFVPCMVDVPVPMRNQVDNSLLRDNTGAPRFSVIQVPGFRERDELLFREGQSPLPVTRPLAPLATPATEFQATAFEYALRARVFAPTQCTKTLHDVVAQDTDPATAPPFVAERTFCYRIADMAFRPLLSAARLVRYLSISSQWSDQQWYAFLKEHELLIGPPTTATTSENGGGGGGGGGVSDQPTYIERLYAAVMAALSVDASHQAGAEAEAGNGGGGAVVNMPDVREHLLFYMTYSRLEVAEVLKNMLMERELDPAYRPPTGNKPRATNGKTAGVESFIAQLKQFSLAYIPLFDWFIKRLQMGAPIDDATLLESCPANEQLSLDDVRRMQVANLILQSDADATTTWYRLLEPRYQCEVRPGDFMFVQCRTTIQWQPTSAERIARHYSVTANTTTSSHHHHPPSFSAAAAIAPIAAAPAATADVNDGRHRTSTVIGTGADDGEEKEEDDASTTGNGFEHASLLPLETLIIGSLFDAMAADDDECNRPNANKTKEEALLYLHSVLDKTGNKLRMPIYATESTSRRSVLDELNARTFTTTLLDKVAMFRTHPEWKARHSLWMPDRVAVHVPAIGAAKDAETLELVEQCRQWNSFVAKSMFETTLPTDEKQKSYAVLSALTDTLNHAMHCRSVESARLAALTTLYNQQTATAVGSSFSSSSSASVHKQPRRSADTLTSSGNKSAQPSSSRTPATQNRPLDRLFDVVGEYSHRPHTAAHNKSHAQQHQQQPSLSGGGDVDTDDAASDTSSVMAAESLATPLDETKRDALELQHFLEQCEADDNMAIPDADLEQRHQELLATLEERRNDTSSSSPSMTSSDYTLFKRKNLRNAVEMAQSDAAQQFYKELDARRQRAAAATVIVEAAQSYHRPLSGPFALNPMDSEATELSSHHGRLNMPPPPHVAHVRFSNNDDADVAVTATTAEAPLLAPLQPARVPVQSIVANVMEEEDAGGGNSGAEQRGRKLVAQIMAHARVESDEKQRDWRALVLRLCIDYWTDLVHALTTFIQTHMRMALTALQADDPCDAYFFAVAPTHVLSRFDVMQPNDTFSASERFLHDMTHHVLDMQQFIGNKNVATATSLSVVSTEPSKTTAATTTTTTTTTTSKASRKRSASASEKKAEDSGSNKADKATPMQPQPLVYQAWMQVLQRAMPRVCHVHIATRHIVDFANASTEFLLCVLRLLRVSLMGGYRYEQQMVDFNTCLVLERMFIECEQAAASDNAEVAACVLAPFRTFLACNALVVLYAVREYLVRMIELSPAIDAFIRSHYRDYDMFVRYVRVCVGAMRVALSHNRSLQGINEQTAKALANKTSQKLWTSYRAESGVTFVSRLCAVFRRIDQDKVAMQICRNPYAEQYHVEKLPVFVAEAVYSYVCALEPGESFKAHWLRDLGFREHTIELVHRLAACYDQLSDKTILAYLLPIPNDEYSMLALFFHLLAYHAMRRLVPLEPCLTAMQMTALRQHYHVPCDELVPEHLTTTYCCSALACYELLTAINSGLRSTTRVAKQPGVRQDYESHALYCTNKRMRRDQENNTQQKRNRNTKKYELMREAYENLRRRPDDKQRRHAYEMARDDFYAACMKNARLLVRSQYEYACHEMKTIALPSVGHVLQWCKVKDTPTYVLCTLCPRCAHYGVFSTMLCDANGYSCGVCDAQERALLREPCCVVCARPVSATRERASVKQHNAMTTVRRMFGGYGYKASRKYEAKAVATGASMRYRAADDIEPRHVLLVDDTSDWQLRPFMVCAGCYMQWMPAASLELTRSEFVCCALNRVDSPHQAHLGKQMEL